VSKVKEAEFGAAVEQCRRKHPRWSAGDCEGWVYSEKKVSLDYLKRFTSGGIRWNEFVGDISCPALLISAQRGIVSEDTARVAARAIRSLKTVRIKGAGHSIHRDRFEEFLEVVARFLGEVCGEQVAPDPSGPGLLVPFRKKPAVNRRVRGPFLSSEVLVPKYEFPLDVALRQRPDLGRVHPDLIHPRLPSRSPGKRAHGGSG
jgi:hypothetical protein